jgi:chromosome segregation ATPase
MRHGGRIERIEGRIARLGGRAEKLLDRERGLEERLAAQRSPRAGRRAERKLESLRADRGRMVEAEVRSIMLALKEESGRTRERLDRELERLVPLEREWERLRALFDALEQTIATPAVGALATQWQGGLEIPDFPVSERTGYVKPFPPKAILF